MSNSVQVETKETVDTKTQNKLFPQIKFPSLKKKKYLETFQVYNRVLKIITI